jgi:hypothetical protein
MVLNIITLRLYQVYEVLNAKSREECDIIDKRIKVWIYSYVSIIVIIRVSLSVFQFVDFFELTEE